MVDRIRLGDNFIQVLPIVESLLNLLGFHDLGGNALLQQNALSKNHANFSKWISLFLDLFKEIGYVGSR